jgi:acyl dehydratase
MAGDRPAFPRAANGYRERARDADPAQAASLNSYYRNRAYVMTDLPKTEKLYLDDLAVGAEFNSEKYAVVAEEIHEFAKNFDPQPFHLDEETARKTLFEGLIASGWHTAAITMRLLVHSVPIAGGIIGAGGEITWPRPTRPGDVLNVVSTIVNISPSKSKPDRGIVTIQSHTLNQHGELCQRLIAKVLVFRRG